MAEASQIVLSNGAYRSFDYEPFGAGVAFQTYNPVQRLADGIVWMGDSVLGAAANEMPAAAERLVIQHNRGQSNATKRNNRLSVRIPIVREVDGVSVVYDEYSFFANTRSPLDLTKTERVRLARTVNALFNAQLIEDMLESDVHPW
jgi:hypothetical protein